jgi:hypothetical protein
MEIGDSFIIAPHPWEDAALTRRRLASTVKSEQDRYGTRYILSLRRAEKHGEEGVRIWKIA